MISAFLGPYFFLLVPQLHIIRMAPAFFLSAGVITNWRIRPSGTVVALFWFFTIYFTYTFVLSVYYLSDIGINNVVNFLVLILFVYSLLLSVCVDPRVFLKSMRIAILIFMVSALAVAGYEEKTLDHLHLSSMLSVPKRWPENHFPTTFFTNPNDFAGMFTFSAMFLLTYVAQQESRIKKLYGALGLLFSWLWVVSVTESRVNLICFVIFVAFYFKLWRPAAIVSLIVSGLGILAAFPNVLSWVQKRSASLLDFSFTSGESLTERLAIIQYGARSVLDSNTFGFGVGSSQKYYSEFVGKGLTGVTLDPHNYVLELLINSGLWMLILYLVISAVIFWHMIASNTNRLIIVQFALYNFVLLSSSASLFLWPHYIFFIAYATYDIQHRASLASQHSTVFEKPL